VTCDTYEAFLGRFCGKRHETRVARCPWRLLVTVPTTSLTGWCLYQPTRPGRLRRRVESGPCIGVAGSGTGEPSSWGESHETSAAE
jgi:hypothetical protein